MHYIYIYYLQIKIEGKATVTSEAELVYRDSGYTCSQYLMVPGTIRIRSPTIVRLSLVPILIIATIQPSISKFTIAFSIIRDSSVITVQVVPIMILIVLISRQWKRGQIPVTAKGGYTPIILP